MKSVHQFSNQYSFTACLKPYCPYHNFLQRPPSPSVNNGLNITSSSLHVRMHYCHLCIFLCMQYAEMQQEVFLRSIHSPFSQHPLANAHTHTRSYTQTKHLHFQNLFKLILINQQKCFAQSLTVKFLQSVYFPGHKLPLANVVYELAYQWKISPNKTQHRKKFFLVFCAHQKAKHHVLRILPQQHSLLCTKIVYILSLALLYICTFIKFLVRITAETRECYCNNLDLCPAPLLLRSVYFVPLSAQKQEYACVHIYWGKFDTAVDCSQQQ